MHVTSVIWAFNFAGVLEPEVAELVSEVLCIVGHEMDRSGLRLHKMPTFQEGSHSGPDEPYVELDIGDMMVICKPPGWEVDTEDVGHVRRLSQYLQYLCAWSWRSWAVSILPSHGFVHRLDVPDSGLILTAKTSKAYWRLKFQLSVGTLMRDYVVMCHGFIPLERRKIKARVYYSRLESNLQSTICQKGKPSMTSLKVLAHLARQQQNFSLVAIRIHTGRRHQIRTHMTHIGHPTVCDGKYTAPQTFLADRK